MGPEVIKCPFYYVPEHYNSQAMSQRMQAVDTIEISCSDTMKTPVH